MTTYAQLCGLQECLMRKIDSVRGAFDYFADTAQSVSFRGERKTLATKEDAQLLFTNVCYDNDCGSRVSTSEKDDNSFSLTSSSVTLSSVSRAMSVTVDNNIVNIVFVVCEGHVRNDGKIDTMVYTFEWNESIF
jgi:hypothetical protein